MLPQTLWPHRPCQRLPRFHCNRLALTSKEGLLELSGDLVFSANEFLLLETARFRRFELVNLAVLRSCANRTERNLFSSVWYLGLSLGMRHNSSWWNARSQIGLRCEARFALDLCLSRCVECCEYLSIDRGVSVESRKNEERRQLMRRKYT